MKKLTFEFNIADDGELEFTASHDNLTRGELYVCALVASQSCGQALRKSMERKGKTKLETSVYFAKARSFAREFVGA